MDLAVDVGSDEPQAQVAAADTHNIFDVLPALSTPNPNDLRDELARYLSTDPEYVADVLLFWSDRKTTYPNLSRMALDYLSIPGEFCVCFHVIELIDISSNLC